MFNNIFYGPENGLSMSSSLSPLLADIFMLDLEKKILKTKFREYKIMARYMDDILVSF